MSIDEFYNNTYVYPEDWWYLASTAWPVLLGQPDVKIRPVVKGAETDGLVYS